MGLYWPVILLVTNRRLVAQGANQRLAALMTNRRLVAQGANRDDFYSGNHLGLRMPGGSRDQRGIGC